MFGYFENQKTNQFHVLCLNFRIETKTKTLFVISYFNLSKKTKWHFEYRDYLSSTQYYLYNFHLFPPVYFWHCQINFRNNKETTYCTWLGSKRHSINLQLIPYIFCSKSQNFKLSNKKFKCNHYKKINKLKKFKQS